MFYSLSNYTSTQNRVVGLASGLDIDSMVKGLTLNTQAKITSKLQEKQLLAWKTDAYRSISNKMVAFSNKYFSYTSSTNLLSSSFFKSSIASASGDYKDLIKVSGNTANASKITLNKITSVASNANVIGKNDVVKPSLTLNADNLSDKTINNLAGKDVIIKDKDGNELLKVEFQNDFSLTDPKEIADYINSQTQIAGVNVSVINKDGIDMFEFKNNGEKISISGTALDVLGVKGNSIETGKTIQSQDVSNLNFEQTTSLAGKKISFNLSGTTKEITLSESGYSSALEMQQDLQQKLNKAFGDNKLEVSIDNGSINIKTIEKTAILQVATVDKDITDLTGVKAGDVNRINLDKPIGELNLSETLTGGAEGKVAFTINDEYFEIDTNTESIGDLMRKINNSNANVKISYSSSTNKFNIESKETGSFSKIEIKNVGIKQEDGSYDDSTISNITQALFGDASNSTYSAGQDTKISVNYNGEELEFSSSDTNITIDGVVLNITQEAFEKAQGVQDLNIKFASTPDTAKIVNTMKEFFNDYNEIFELVNSEYKTSKSAEERSYKPLTDEQKAEMTESQIEEWEKIAKKGLLYGSTELNSLSSELRSSITMLLSNNQLASQIGISTSSTWSDNGKIVFDEKAFEEALLKDPDKVIDMLTKGFDDNYKEGSAEYTRSGGVMTRLKSTFDKYSSNVGSKGILINIAGLDNSISATNNTLYKKTQMIDKQLEALKKTLANETNRHYATFTRLETYISNMNAQSSWLYSQSSY